MPLFVNRVGEGVFVPSKPRVHGQKARLSREEQDLAEAGLWMHLYERGLTYRDIAERFGVAHTTVMRRVKKVRKAMTLVRGTSRLYGD